MASTIAIRNKPKKKKRIHLKTWREAEAYFKEHLRPVAHSPKGWPLYRQADIDALNVVLPEDMWSE